MKLFPILAGVLGLMMVHTGFAEAEPFAEIVDIPAAMTNEDHDDYFDAMAAKNSVVPSRSEVGFPAYPNAKILFTQMDNQVKENGKWVDLPKRIFMGTPDSVEQVVEFYKTHLKDWKFKKIYSVPTFYKKEGEFNPLEDLMTPRIMIAPEFRDRRMMPASKTTIDIYYTTAE